jgi:hypothetical protein
MQPGASAKQDALVERIKAARAALNMASDPDLRSTLLDELGAATLELTELILEKGRLNSHLS